MSEIHLMQSVRDRIRAAAAYTGPPDITRQINVEWDERAPATAGTFYIMVTFGSVEAGPTYVNGKTSDFYYGVNIAVAIRAPKKPRDRQRELWIELTKSFYYHQKQIADQIDFDYTTINNANTQMYDDSEAADNGCEDFIEPLRFQSLGPIRAAPAEIFAGTIGEPTAALIRTIRYRGARRLVKR